MNPTTLPALPHTAPPPDATLDANLPAWARRSNPVVRRELGQHWKRLFPDVGLLARVVAVQAVLVAVLPLGLLMTVTLPVMVVSVLAVPVALFLYGRTVVTMIHAAAAAIVDAHTHHTLDLLRVSLVPLRHIVLGKVAASLWRRMDDIDLILLGAALAGTPTLTVYHFGPLHPDEVTLGLRLVAAVGVLALPVRLVLEPFMLAAVALATGTVSPTRAGAVVVTVAFAAFYFALALLPYLLRWPGVWLLAGGVVVPLATSALLTAGAVQFAVWRIRAS